MRWTEKRRRFSWGEWVLQYYSVKRERNSYMCEGPHGVKHSVEKEWCTLCDEAGCDDVYDVRGRVRRGRCAPSWHGSYLHQGWTRNCSRASGWTKVFKLSKHMYLPLSRSLGTLASWSTPDWSYPRINERRHQRSRFFISGGSSHTICTSRYKNNVHKIDDKAYYGHKLTHWLTK